MARKLVFVAFGSLGDIYPLLAVAEIMKKSHDVVFLANKYFAPHIDSRGIPFHSIGTIEDQLAAIERPSSSGETKEGRLLRFENIIGKSFGPTFTFLENEIKNGRDLVVISHGNLSPAAIACETFGIPTVITYYATSQIPHNNKDQFIYNEFHGKGSWWSRLVRTPINNLAAKFSFEIQESLNGYRKQYSLPPLPAPFFRELRNVFPLLKRNVSGLKVHKHIALLPSWFCYPVDKSFTYIDFVGFPFLADLSAEDTNLMEFIKRNSRPIVFTPGTAVEDVEIFCSEMVSICRKLSSPGIFVSKHGRDHYEALTIPEDVQLFFVEHANFEKLLPYARCLIHHGGIGTVAQAVRAGIPQIIRPRMYDQPINGLRVMMCGLGGSVSVSNFNADTVANILLHIESSDLHQERILYYSNILKREDGAFNCSQLIQHFLSQDSERDEAYSESVAVH